MLGSFAIENSWFSDTYWTCKIGGKIGGILKTVEFINSKKKKRNSYGTPLELPTLSCSYLWSTSSRPAPSLEANVWPI